MAILNATAKTKQMGITRFAIHGKRWFQKSAGNTYHSCTLSALVGDEWVGLGKVDFEYGYDEGYTQTGVDWLIEKGYLDKSPPHANGNASHYGYPFRQDNNIDTHVIDVDRKRDL
jgi:hypothetical protein